MDSIHSSFDKYVMKVDIRLDIALAARDSAMNVRKPTRQVNDITIFVEEGGMGDRG